MNTVLITGCSSGFGLAIARHFLTQGWQVIAKMRTPRADLLPISPRLQMLPLDVTDANSIKRAVQAAGPVDVLVNNAGVGMLNALEGTPRETVHEVFAVNALGTIAMSQAVLPQMRERRAGVIVNVTSSVTLMPLPLLSVYTASKAAVNAFTESVALELAPFHVRMRLVLPGRAPDTGFGENARARMGSIPEAYAGVAQQVFAGWAASDDPVTQVPDVVAAVWRAATDPGCPMLLPAGADALALAQQRG